MIGVGLWNSRWTIPYIFWPWHLMCNVMQLPCFCYKCPPSTIFLLCLLLWSLARLVLMGCTLPEGVVERCWKNFLMKSPRRPTLVQQVALLSWGLHSDTLILYSDIGVWGNWAPIRCAESGWVLLWLLQLYPSCSQSHLSPSRMDLASLDSTILV